jgi:hypothetical protein
LARTIFVQQNLSVTAGTISTNVTCELQSTGSTYTITGGGTFGNINVNASGSTYNLASAISVSGTLTITLGTLDVTALNNYGITITANGGINFNAGTFNAQAGTITFTGSGAQTLSTASSLYNLTINKSGGSLTASSSLTVSNSLTTNAANYNVSLNGATNSIAGVTTFSNTGAGSTLTIGASGGTSTFTGGLVAIAPSAVTVNGTVSTTNTAMNLGAVTLGSNASLTTGTGAAATLSVGAVIGGTFNLSMNSGANAALALSSFSGTGTLTVANAGNTGVSVSGAVTTSALSITTSAGSIVLSGAVTVSGNSSFTANAAGSSITVNNVANAFTGTVTFAGSGGLQNITIVDTSALDLIGPLTLSGNLSATAATTLSQSGGALTINGTTTLTASAANTDILLASQPNVFNGAITVNGGANVRDLLLRNATGTAGIPALPSALRNLTLTWNSAALNLPAVSITGDLSVTAGGAITQAGALSVALTSSFTTGAFAITLNSANSFSGAVSFSNSGANAVQVTNGIALVLGASTVGGSLTATATTGNITQSALVTVTGTASFTTSAANASISLPTLAATGAIDLHTNGAVSGTPP